MNTYKKEKSQLIRDGIYQDYIQAKKEAYLEGFVMSDDPNDYGLSELELDLLKRLEKSTKRKKSDFRRHAYFMSDYYDNIGLLTLTYSDKALTLSNLETKKQQLTTILKFCFQDYIGKYEISPAGRLHFHAIVAWYGPVKTRPVYRNNRKNEQVINKSDLQELWYGEDDGTGQPTRYGVYDLVLVQNTKSDKDKATNYAMKSLNTMESYIQKDEEIEHNQFVDEELVYAVNTSNIITARGTPYQSFKNAQDTQDKEIKRKARVFDTPYYEKNKWNGKKVFREWALDNKTTNIALKKGEHIDLIGNDFKLITPNDF